MSAVYEEQRVYEPHVQAEAGFTPPPPPPPRPPRRNHHGRVLAAAIAGLVLVGVAGETLPPGTPGHELWTSVVGTAPVAASSGTTAAPQVDPQLAAIQAVIQKANAEQVQAISAQNPSVMADTATPAHYQQLVQLNQNLVAHGVTSIQLTTLSCGPITIHGSTASATSYEPWVTTFSDSTTLHST